MKKTKVIASSNFPKKLPLSFTLIMALALDKWNAPEWLWGAVGFLVLFAWIQAFIEMSRQEPIDIFEEKGKKP